MQSFVFRSYHIFFLAVAAAHGNMFPAEEERLAVISDHVAKWHTFAQQMRDMEVVWAREFEVEEHQRLLPCTASRMDHFESDTRAEARRQERRRWMRKWRTMIDRIQDEADLEDVDALCSSQEATCP